jgi:DNA-binding XRE family transcriptional regulator
MATVKADVMRWVGDQLAADSQLRERVESRLAALRIEQDLVALREERGLTQAQLARRLGVSQPAVAKIESGSENLTLRTLLRVVTALGGELTITIRPTAKVVGIRTATRPRAAGGRR